MKIVRAKYQGEIFYGELHEGEVLRYEGSPLVIWEPTEEKYSLEEIQLLAPVLPSKVTGVAKNYEKHAVELGVHDYTAPSNPVFFNKPSTSVIGTGENINEGPLGYDFPKYEERKNRLIESLTIIRRLLNGEKLSFNGEYYKTEKAKLYSPPLKHIPIWLAAGGPKSAQVAAEYADGLMISVKDPKDSYERVIDPAKEKTSELKKDNLSVHTYRWTMFAENDDDAWTALRSWRGLRAPSRLQQLDPEALRLEADSFPKEEIMGKFSKASTIDELYEIYKPLVNEFDSEIVTIQISSINQEETIRLLGKELLPKLRK